MWTYTWFYSKWNEDGCRGAIGRMYKDGIWQATFRYKQCQNGSELISYTIHHECTEVHG